MSKKNLLQEYVVFPEESRIKTDEKQTNKDLVML